MLIDGDQRTKATNPQASFIVQAPAGSGKTEILTQRFLRLLATVNNPEQIIALTFTRKAASEMRERIILALQQVAKKQTAKSDHQQKTFTFAKLALERDALMHWDLLQQPNRLKIITIDALCQMLNQSIPMLEQHVAFAQISDKPHSVYLQAARNCMDFSLKTKAYQPAISQLLLHVDNQPERLLKLLVELLAQRDQWLGLLFQARDQDQAYFEQALQSIETHELQRFKYSLPSILAQSLTDLAREIAAIENNASSARFVLRDWYEFKQITAPIAVGLAHLLLTGEGNFRQAFDHHVGLKRGVCPNADFERIKDSSKTLLAQLADYPDFYTSLLQISQLPKPQYDPEQWQVLQALFLLLPVLVGHLHMSFAQDNVIDFTANAQQALLALGEADNPTDLALYLDNSIQHLLVDEFQDTSLSQFELLTRLVQGWESHQGKTLFLVGDPMQSIYRFRQAEVGLFYKAQQQGIGPVRLEFLELQCNFRSTPTIIQWVNQHFAYLFPRQIDIESGAVCFHPSTHVLPDHAASTIQAIAATSRQQEAEKILDLVKQELAQHPQDNIAILVRSRSHLRDIIRLLREQGIAYQGTDIDLLAHLDHLRDVWSLTQALLNPGNRLSWLALLRSPYCGLELADLLAIAAFNNKQSIYASLLQLPTIDKLSQAGRERASFLLHIMHTALTKRYQKSLSAWVQDTHKLLHGTQILNPNQQADLEQFWSLLDKYEQQGRIPNSKAFNEQLLALYSQQASPSRLHIMTIHKSKGLEFDCVILPGLNAQPNKGDLPLLRWLKIPSEQHGELLLVSPIRAVHQEHCALYDYLGRLDAEKAHYETQRLFYVAATRARSRLYLLSNSSRTAKGSFKQLLQQQQFEELATDNETSEFTAALPQLIRLEQAWYQLANKQDQTYLNPQLAPLASGIPRLLGIVAHQLLHWICDKHATSVADIPWDLAANEFKRLGLTTATTSTCMQTLRQQIEGLCNDATGAWIVQAHHNEHNEYELLVESNHRLVTRIIDRCFIFADRFWIIDFKTGKDDEQSLAKHQQQLQEYAFYLRDKTALPIECGLYYLTSRHWINWSYTGIHAAPIIQSGAALQD